MTYEQIKSRLKTIEEFQNEMSLEKMYSLLRTQERISHCGYPDYMPQAGAEGTYISLTPIPNTDNWIFEYNKYTGGEYPDEYETTYCIVSSEEKNIIISHWDEKQYQNELAFEVAWISQCENKY